MAQPTTSTVGRERLIDSLDTVADVAHAVEQAVDNNRPLNDPDDLIARIRGIIVDLAFDLEASDFLADADEPHPAPPASPGQQALDLGEALRQLDVDHHQARERIFAELSRRGAAAPPACLHWAAPLTLARNGKWGSIPTPAAPSPTRPMWPTGAPTPRSPSGSTPKIPPVWADNGNVIIALGDPGAGVEGVRTHFVLSGATATRWFSDLIGQLRGALDVAAHQRHDRLTRLS